MTDPDDLRSALTGPGSPLRYAAAGLVNTGAGYLGILGASALGVPPVLANALGFALGFLVSLSLARRWTFTEDEAPRSVTARYLACFLACWILNVAVLRMGLGIGAPAWLAQGLGVGAYAVVFYLAARLLVFGQGARLAADLRLLAAAVTGRGSAAAHGPRSRPAPSRPSS